MKKMNQAIAACILFSIFTACSDSGTSTTTNDSASIKNEDATNNPATDNSSNANTPPQTTMTPLNKEDSMFVMKAAMGGKMEVEASNLALQNSSSDRVKSVASMIANDHNQANAELMAFASKRNISLPASLSGDMQTHIEGMRKMQGKAFDKHYVSMMMNDHKKDIAEFEKAAQNCADEELKGWAAKTLPTLKAHKDSIAALGKMKM